MYVVSRFAMSAVSLAFMTALIFGLVRLTGDPLAASLPIEATEEQRQAMAIQLGLDKPLVIQYRIFVSELARGNLGISVQYRPTKVTELISDRWVATFQLALLGNLTAIAIAVPLGITAAKNRGKMKDVFVRLIGLFGQSVPVFWVGLMLILLFANVMGVLPTSGKGSWTSFILPATSMAFFIMPGIVRILRSSMIEALNSDYITQGRAQGVPERVLIWKYALRNASIPVSTFAGLIFLNSLAGAVVTETVFAWPGLGRLAVQAVANRDFPVVQGVVLTFTATYLLGNLIIDLLYGYLDPRVRLSHGST